jgi:hypothetical protein
MSLADQHPGVQAVDAKVADLARRRAEFEANASRLAALDAEAQAEYDKALDLALRDGAPAPEPLVLRLNGEDVEARHQFMYEERELTEERRKAVAAAYPDVLKEARGRARKLVKAARPTVEQLADAMREVLELTGAVQVCRDAGNDDRRVFNDPRLSVAEFIRVAATGGDPIASALDLTGDQQEFRPRNTGMLLGDVQQLLAGSFVPQQPVATNRP